jgi:hypothetical protein
MGALETLFSGWRAARGDQQLSREP